MCLREIKLCYICYFTAYSMCQKARPLKSLCTSYCALFMTRKLNSLQHSTTSHTIFRQKQGKNNQKAFCYYEFPRITVNKVQSPIHSFSDVPRKRVCTLRSFIQLCPTCCAPGNPPCAERCDQPATPPGARQSPLSPVHQKTTILSLKQTNYHFNNLH